MPCSVVPLSRNHGQVRTTCIPSLRNAGSIRAPSLKIILRSMEKQLFAALGNSRERQFMWWRALQGQALRWAPGGPLHHPGALS